MPAKGPIQHVVLIIKENHTFDNYFGTFPGVNGDSTLVHSPNPPTQSPSNSHTAWLNRATKALRQQYIEADIPTYFAYARQFTLADNYFTDVASDSTPNHLMLIAADSPVISNISSGSTETFDIPSLPASMDAAGVSWANYGGFAFAYIQALAGKPELPSAQFAKDAAAGKLPAVSWVYAPGGLSEHPRDNVTQGMQWTVAQVNAVVAGGLWPETAIFITWDDWGGYYDHVTPGDVEQWTDGTQFRYGSRVGCLALSPYAKAGYVSSVLHSHVSLLKFCEDTFALPSLNVRDAGADGMTDCFDFTQKPARPPAAAASGAARARAGAKSKSKSKPKLKLKGKPQGRKKAAPSKTPRQKKAKRLKRR
ncbi:MAG: phospholipase C [Terriglobia bacterium]